MTFLSRLMHWFRPGGKPGVAGAASPAAEPRQGPLQDDGERFRLEASLMTRERSKDSSWSLSTVSIKGSTMSLAREYGGFTRRENECRSLPMTPDMEERIRSLLASSRLSGRVREMRETDGIGISATLSLTVTAEPATHIEIRGMSHIWTGKGGPESNLRHIDLVHAAEDFINGLWLEEPES